MKKIQLGTSDQKAAAVILGCMRINNAEDPVKVIETAYENGIDFFDHADIYGNGECEEIFADALAKTSIKREDLFIQTKCGIVPGVMFDFSKKHIIESVEKSLTRLKMDYVDALLLHRPDTLVEPEEVAEAFDELERSGKVRYFGVSNQKPMQIELLKKYVRQPLVANQLQFGLKHTGMIDQGIHVNMTIQAWSPYQYGFFEGVFIGNEKFPELNQTLEELAAKYQTTPTGLASAWILRHPANMQVIAGTMNVGRIKEIAQASEINMSREDWYELYRAAGNILP